MEVWKVIRMSAQCGIDLQSWASLLQILIDSGRLGDALSILCGEMKVGSGSPPAPYPTKSLLFWISKGFREKRIVSERLKAAYPELWPEVEESLGDLSAREEQWKREDVLSDSGKTIRQE